MPALAALVKELGVPFPADIDAGCDRCPIVSVAPRRTEQEAQLTDGSKQGKGSRRSPSGIASSASLLRYARVTAER